MIKWNQTLELYIFCVRALAYHRPDSSLFELIESYKHRKVYLTLTIFLLQTISRRKQTNQKKWFAFISSKRRKWISNRTNEKIQSQQHSLKFQRCHKWVYQNRDRENWEKKWCCRAHTVRMNECVCSVTRIVAVYLNTCYYRHFSKLIFIFEEFLRTHATGTDQHAHTLKYIYVQIFTRWKAFQTATTSSRANIMNTKNLAVCIAVVLVYACFSFCHMYRLGSVLFSSWPWHRRVSLSLSVSRSVHVYI